MLTVMLILAVAALLAGIVAAMGKCPVWVSVILLALYACLEQIPKG
jgi:hypothetical protein